MSTVALTVIVFGWMCVAFVLGLYGLANNKPSLVHRVYAVLGLLMVLVLLNPLID